MKDDLARLIARHSFKGMSTGLLPSPPLPDLSPSSPCHASSQFALIYISPWLPAVPLADDFAGSILTEVRFGPRSRERM